jgi:hypothetical protein
MAVTAENSGTQSTSGNIGVELTLDDVDTAGTYTLHVDKSVLAAGDSLELRIYQMVLTGGTRRVAYFQRYADAQPTDDMIAISVPISNELTDSGALRFTLNQTKGTARSFPWKILKYS